MEADVSVNTTIVDMYSIPPKTYFEISSLGFLRFEPEGSFIQAFS